MSQGNSTGARLRRSASALVGVQSGLLDEPAVTDDDRLSGQRVRSERSQKQRGLRHIVDGREVTVDGFLEHHVLNNFLLGDTELFRLFGNLLVNKRGTHETWA